jgi:hypothetical protein
MAARTFTTPDGILWQAWDVDPAQHGEWSAKARQHLPAHLVHGWLCFESAAGKRRLQPIPDDWDRRSDAELREHLRAAEPVRRRTAAKESHDS